VVSGQLHVPAALPRGKSPPPPPDIHWIGSWVDRRAGLDDVEKRKFLILPGFELRPLGLVEPVSSRYTEYAIQASHLPVLRETILQQITHFVLILNQCSLLASVPVLCRGRWLVSFLCLTDRHFYPACFHTGSGAFERVPVFQLDCKYTQPLLNNLFADKHVPTEMIGAQQ
jgi:hypothetical protein